jgi:hypothetical protein
MRAKAYIGLLVGMSLHCSAVDEPNKEWPELRAKWLARESETRASEDGAMQLAHAAERLKNSAELDGLGVLSSVAHLQDAAERYLPSLRGEFELIEGALQRPALGFAIGDEPGRPSAYVLSSIGDALVFRALAWATEGNLAGAAATLGDLAELGRRVPLHSKSPARGVVAMTIADVVRRMATAEMRECGGYSATDLRALLDPVLRRVPRMPTDAQVIEGDLVQAVSAVDKWLRDMDVSDVWGASCVARDVGEFAGQRSERVVALTVRYVRAIQTGEDRSESKGVAAMRDALAVLERTRSSAVTEVSIARAGLAALAYHEQHGEWPTSLVALADSFPGGEVPRGGAGALHYNRTGQRVMIWAGDNPERVGPSWTVSDDVVEK